MSKYECKICNEEKQLIHFSKNKGVCKKCNNLYESERRKFDGIYKLKQQSREKLRWCFNDVRISPETKSEGAQLLGFQNQEDLVESLLKTSFTGRRDGMEQDHFLSFSSVTGLKIHGGYKKMAVLQISQKANIHFLSIHLNSKKGIKSPKDWIMTLTQAIRRPDSIIGKELLQKGTTIKELEFELKKSKRMLQQIKPITSNIKWFLESEMEFKETTMATHKMIGISPPHFCTDRERRYEQQELQFKELDSA